MGKQKIVLMGAASASFGLRSLIDAFRCPQLKGSTLTLVDMDEARLEVMARLARRMNEEIGAGFTIEHTVHRREALPDAQFVVLSIAVKRNELWKLDFEIPLKYGIKQVLGENGGPGGLLYAMRNIPIILEICRDMETLCPDGLLLNFTNPESRICLAVSQHTRVRSVGLCHGIVGQLANLARVLEIPADDIDARAAGLNHFTWIMALRRKHTDEDLYPALRRKLSDYDPAFQPLCRELFDAFGRYPSPSDDHVGEYLSYAWEKCGLKGYHFEAADQAKASQWRRIEAMASGEAPLGDLLARPSGEIAFDIIADILDDRREVRLAVNVPNEGLIPNLPREAVIEVPAVVDRDGVHGMEMGELPKGIAAMCTTQFAVQQLVVEAAVTGSRETALQALLIDPVVHSAEAARKTLDALLEIHAPYLPQFRS